MEKRPLRKQVVSFCVLSAGFWVVCLGIELFCHVTLRRGVYDWPLLRGTPFSDFSLWVYKMRHMHTEALYRIGNMPFLYPPAAIPFQWVFCLLPHPTYVFLCFEGLLSAGMAALFAGHLAQTSTRTMSAVRLAAALLFTSFPVAMCIGRGNIELFMFALTGLGTWAILRGRNRLAGACIGIAGAAKIYPFILVALMLRRREWRGVLCTGVVAVLFTGACLWLIHPNLAIATREVQYGLQFSNQQIISVKWPVEGGYDHSIMGVYKRLHHGPIASMTPILRWYLPAAAAAALCVWWTRWRLLPMENEVLGLVTTMITIMPMSYDYTLLHLYIPLAIILAAVQAGYGGRIVWGTLCLLAIAMAPMAELIWHNVTFANVPRCGALLGLIVLSAWRPIFRPEIYRG